jgi:hypothetical protein
VRQVALIFPVSGQPPTVIFCVHDATRAEVPDVAGVCAGVADPAVLPSGLAVRLPVAVPLPPVPQPASTAPASIIPAAEIAVIGLRPAKR